MGPGLRKEEEPREGALLSSFHLNRKGGMFCIPTSEPQGGEKGKKGVGCSRAVERKEGGDMGILTNSIFQIRKNKGGGGRRRGGSFFALLH